MTYQVPNATRVLVVARRLDTEVQTNSAIVVGIPARITYDIESFETGIVLRKEGVVPVDRPVAANGSQVDIRAASWLSEATFQVMPDGTERLFVREGIVFGDCSGG
jgi:hypothetical protein